VIRDLVAIFGVIAGFSYYVLTVRNANKARWKDVLLQRINTLDDDFYTKWRTHSLRDVNTYEEWLKYDEKHPRGIRIHLICVTHVEQYRSPTEG